MAKKDKFNPQIKKIKLNPEQAVLSCNCYKHNHVYQWAGHVTGWGIQNRVAWTCGSSRGTWADMVSSAAGQAKQVTSSGNS